MKIKNNYCFLLVIVVVISGCIPFGRPRLPPEPYYINYDRVLYMGDSVCLAVKDSGSDPTFMQVGLKRQCANGVKLTDISYIPSDYDLIFLHYGANDIKGITTSEQFRSQLIYLLPTTSAKVYCVLPITSAKLASGDAFRQVMFDECTYTLDPTDFGVTAGKDGIHWLSEGHNKFTPAVQGVLDFEGIIPLPEPVLYQP